MTDSQITLTKKVSKLTRESATRKLSTVNVVLDYNKFNLYFVLSVMIIMLSSLDSLFGLKESFSDLHKWFQRCVLIGVSRTRPPRIARDGLPEEGPYCFRRHEGGLEGMGQKIWTLFAQLLIRFSMVLCGLRGSIIGQGDNQVIVLRLTKDQSLRSKAVVQNFLRVLRHESAKKNNF